MKKPPISKKNRISKKIGQNKITDDYYWLENESKSKVKKWIKDQNKYTNYKLKKEGYKLFKKELTKDYKVTNFSLPYPVNGFYFFLERLKGEEQDSLYFKKGLNGKLINLVNPNKIKTDGSVYIDFWDISESGKFIAYGLTEKGSEFATIYIKDVKTGKNLPEHIFPCIFTSLVWLIDDSGFFYTKNLPPKTVNENKNTLYTKVFFHRLGTDPREDVLIFGENRPSDDMIELKLSLDGVYLTISVSQNWSSNEIYLYNIKSKIITTLTTGVQAQFYPLFLEEYLLLKTNYLADKYRILIAPISELNKPIDQWKEFVPEKNSVLESINITKNKILLTYLIKVCHQIIVYNHKGLKQGIIKLPSYSSLTGVSTNDRESEFFYGVTSFTFPEIIYYYEPLKSKYSIYKKTNNPIKTTDYTTKQKWVTSKDGTRFPIFLFHKKNLIKKTKIPTILYGYGGFGVNEIPGFTRSLLPWVRRGGIFALANIRGGGEFGENWHKQGIKEFKQNSFDDFISATQFLIAKKYTDSDHLGIMGISNGGLLVLSVAIQKPKLFKAVCSLVPLADMIRFHNFGMAIRWVHEYGDPRKLVDFKRILQWSPYHNVKKETEYPNFLLTTATQDNRVNPLHARKMAAILQSVNKRNEVFLLTEKDSGHGIGKSVSKFVETQALILSFLAQKLDLKL